MGITTPRPRTGAALIPLKAEYRISHLDPQCQVCASRAEQRGRIKTEEKPPCYVCYIIHFGFLMILFHICLIGVSLGDSLFPNLLCLIILSVANYRELVNIALRSSHHLVYCCQQVAIVYEVGHTHIFSFVTR